MSEFQLYCFAQSGNAYRAALMLNLIGADWEPVWYDFFGTAPQRTPEFRETINEMGEAPVLVHGKKKLTQSGVILTYLSDLTGKFKPQGEDERLEALRWIIFDNQKVNGFLGPYRFLRNFAKPAGDPAVMAFLKGRIDGSLAIVNKRLASQTYLLGDKPTIADVSMTGYLYYPAEEFGFDIVRDQPAIGPWLERMKALPGWKHPYEFMPGYLALSGDGTARNSILQRIDACGRTVRRNDAVTVSGCSGIKRSARINSAITSGPSIMAMLRPVQTRAPRPKGM